MSGDALVGGRRGQAEPARPGAGSGPPGRRLRLTIRIDDIFNRGHPARPRECRGLLSVAESFGCRVILNVIPRRLMESPNRDGAMVTELRDALDRGHEVIQHGYDHCCGQCGASSHQTYCDVLERDQPLELMLRDIGRGKEMLEAAIGRRVLTYGPTGTDPHSEQLLHVVRLLGFVATTGTPTPMHGRMGLRVVPTGQDYAWGAASEAEFAEAAGQLRAEFEDVLRDGGDYFQVLLHDPFTRSSYQGGATLRYLEENLRFLFERSAAAGVKLEGVLGAQCLGLSEKDQELADPPSARIRISGGHSCEG